jgi:hypothetical protein
LQAVLPGLEKMYQQTPLDVFQSNQRTTFALDNEQQQQLLTSASFPAGSVL